MNRDGIIELFVARGASDEKGWLRRVLSTYTDEELQQAHQRILHDAQMQAATDALIQIQAERTADYMLRQLRMKQESETQRKAETKAQLAQDKQTFADAAKTIRRFGLTEANFNVIRQTLGAGFSIYQIQQMLAANGATLSPPEQRELDEWQSQDIEAHNLRLLSADLPTLRKLAREEGARIAGAQPAPDETQRVRQAEQAMIHGTFPPLPDEFRDGDGPEEVLNTAFIKKCSKETLRLLINRYGSEQVNEALRTRIDGIYQY